MYYKLYNKISVVKTLLMVIKIIVTRDFQVYLNIVRVTYI